MVMTVGRIVKKKARCLYKEGRRRKMRHLKRSSQLNRQTLCSKWRNVLIIKLLGRRINNKYLMTRLLKLWSPLGAYEIMDMDNGFMLIKLQEDKDYHHILHEGSWIVLDHYVVVQRWRPMFDPNDEQVKKLAVWMRIPGLPLEFYSSYHLWRMGNLFGKTLKVDRNSLRKYDGGLGEYTTKAKYAHICVEVDLRKSFISQFQIDDRTFPVSYEGLHLICFNCGRYGHQAEHCSGGILPCPTVTGETKTPTEGMHHEEIGGKKMEEKNEEVFGEWIVVHKPRRGRNTKERKQLHKVEQPRSSPEKRVPGQSQWGKTRGETSEIASDTRFAVLTRPEA